MTWARANLGSLPKSLLPMVLLESSHRCQHISHACSPRLPLLIAPSRQGISRTQFHYSATKLIFLLLILLLAENVSNFFSLPPPLLLLSPLPDCLKREVSRLISRWIQHWEIGEFNIKKLFEAVEWSALPPELEESNEALGNAAPANRACGEPEGLLGVGFVQAS